MWGCVCLKEVCREEVMGSFLEEQVEICLPGVCVCMCMHTVCQSQIEQHVQRLRG